MLKKWQKHENPAFGAISVHCVQLLWKITMTNNTFFQSMFPYLSIEYDNTLIWERLMFRWYLGQFMAFVVAVPLFHFKMFWGKLSFCRFFLYLKSYKIVVIWVNILLYFRHLYMFSHRLDLHCLGQYYTIYFKTLAHTKHVHYCQ